ncbi:MAG TPA: hypothetical protein PKW79_00480 [Rhabdochlamydiaceae bacterium]|nr:hypothetical protein [Rhabdochlamydiaceae bacterium]
MGLFTIDRDREAYTFDFKAPGTGVRTVAPIWTVHELNRFGEALTEMKV